jgi:hypothetical protein
MLNAEKGVRRRVRKSRQKEAARAADAGLMQIECSKQRVSKLAGVAKAAAEGPDAAVQARAMTEVSLSEETKKICGRNGDTLRRDAPKGAAISVCGRVGSCSRGQDRWRTKLELCCCEAFDNDHWFTALGTAP